MKRTIILAIAAVMAFPAFASSALESEMTMISVHGNEVQKPAKKAKAEVKEVIFHVHLHCNACVKKLNENIAFEKGVKGLDVSLEKQSVAIKYDASKTSPEVLKAAVEKLGFKVGEQGHHHH